VKCINEKACGLPYRGGTDGELRVLHSASLFLSMEVTTNWTKFSPNIASKTFANEIVINCSSSRLISYFGDVYLSLQQSTI
jgi:hypothetical protein